METQNNTPNQKFLDLLNGRWAKFLIIGTVVLIILGVFLVFINSRKKLPAKTSGVQDSILVTVGDEKIYKSDVQKAASSQYASSAIDNKVLQTFLDLLIEQKILDQEARKAKVVVNKDEAVKKAKSILKDNEEPSESLIKQARYDLLREKIMRQNVDSRTAYMIGFWTPSAEYPQAEITKTRKAEILVEQAQAQKALPEILSLINSNQEPLDAVLKVMESKAYSTLKNDLAINGYIVDLTADKSLMRTPRVYTVKDKPNLGDKLFDELFSIDKGRVKLVFFDNNASGQIIKMVDVRNAETESYNDWLKLKQKELVKVLNPL